MYHDHLLNRLRAWTYRRQRLETGAGSALGALNDVIAVYSSQPTAPLSLAARVAEPGSVKLEQLEQARQVVRLPAMRGSIFLMPIDTAPWLLAATKTPLDNLAGRLEYAGLDWDDYQQLKAKILEFANEPVNAAELQKAIPTSVKLMVVVRLMSYEGLTLRIGTGSRSDSYRYVATESWLGRPLDEVDETEAVTWLARAYLRAFGPARVADFAWWAGIAKRRAASAFADLPTVDLARDLMILEEDHSAFEVAEPLDDDSVAVIPKWDALTMGYAGDGRERFVAAEHLPLAYPKIRATRGDGAPLVLRRGSAVAAWGHRFKKDTMQIAVSPFDPSDRLEWLDASHFAAAAAALGASEVQLTIGDG